MAEKNKITLDDEENAEFAYKLSSNKKVRRLVNKKRTTTIIVIILLIAILFTGSVFFVLSFIEANSVKITVDNYTNKGISISTEEAFANPTTVLSAAGPEKLDNVTFSNIDIDTIVATEGSVNGESYIAYTFYVKNQGVTDAEVYYYISMNNATNNLDSAIRIMLITEEETLILAKPDSEGNAVPIANNEDELTTPFQGDVQIYTSDIFPIEEAVTTKYSLVIWIEGWDEDCTDDILGGVVSIELSFTYADY
ncbi:MAG: hypothetical protein R3Y23_01495 [Bacillota bacterium]